MSSKVIYAKYSIDCYADSTEHSRKMTLNTTLLCSQPLFGCLVMLNDELKDKDSALSENILARHYIKSHFLSSH